MKVIVSGNVVLASSNTSDVWKLHRLLSYACEGRHAVLFPQSAELESWLATLDEVSRSNYENAIAFSARTATTFPNNIATVLIDTTASPQWNDPSAVLPLDDALMVLGEGLGIFVENAENDWNFILGIMSQRERERVNYIVNKGWASSLHGGGSDLRNQLENRLKYKHKGLRTFVVFDSDRLHPDECLAGWSPERIGKRPVACQAFEWEQYARTEMPDRYWMLKRRFIESYMPQAELRIGAAQSTDAAAVDAFFHISAAGRWYFNMKKGFEGDSRRDDKERCGNLYSNVGTDDLAALQKGFGSGLANHYAYAIDREFDWDNDAREEAARALPKLMRLF